MAELEKLLCTDSKVESLKKINAIIDKSEEGGNYLTTSQITNCITEIPQRIKYTLVDDTLTIKAGSVVIVPYGTEDLTADYPVGATFLHENFKVYDTQFADGKFFVWAEIVEDIVSQQATTAAGSVRLLAIAIQGETFTNSVVANVHTISANTLPNDTRAYQWYQTNTNKCFHVNASRQMNTMSFPIGICISSATTYFGSINQTFNGMGYIGSVFWVDKGVKGLLANGRNEDGSLKSVEWINSSLMLKLVEQKINDYNIVFDLIGSDYGSHLRYFSSEAYVSYETNTWVNHGSGIMNTGLYLPLANLISNADGTITSLRPRQPFRAVDYSDLLCRTQPSSVSTASPSNPVVVIQNYLNGCSWYRVWSDGFIEQGGLATTQESDARYTSVTFLKPFSNTNYTVVCSGLNAGMSNSDYGHVYSRTASSVRFNAAVSTTDIYWMACGY